MVTKIVIISLFFATVNCVAFAQIIDNGLKVFTKSVEKNLEYPPYLVDKCISTSAFIKIVVRNFKVKSIDLSDSAEKLFMTEFLTDKKNFKVNALEEYCSANNIKEAVYLLPVYLHTQKSDCIVDNLDTDLAHRQIKFSGNSYAGQATVLEPLEFIFTKPVR